MQPINRYYALLFMLFCLMVAATLRFPDLPDYPPGVHYDEAANGVLSAEIGLDGERPLFIASYTGKEVLFFYLAGGMMRFIGRSVFALRLTAAFVGIVTIAATYWLGMEIFRDRRVALLAGALLAVSFWHLLFSRLGFRAITQPWLQVMTMGALLRGYRRHDWRWSLVAGLFLGLTAYTYLAARLFPLLLALALVPLIFNKTQWQSRWLQTAVTGLIALAIALPLLSYFWAHPEAFWVRITQVAPGQEGLPLNVSLFKSWGMLFLQGDPYWRFNIPGRPLFDWFWGGLLIVGWVTLVLRWRQLMDDWQRTGYLLLIMAPFVMILPTALATNEIVPSNLRAIGLIPFIFYLPAVGLLILLDDLHKRFNRPQPTTAALTAAALVLAVGGLYVERLYFQQWGQQAEVYFETDADLTAVAQFLDSTDTTGKTVYVAALHYQHPTIAFLSEKYDQVKWLPESQAIVFPVDRPAIYVFPYNSPLARWASPYFSEGSLIDNTNAPDGNPAFVAYELTNMPAISMTHPLTANFDNALTLLGYDVEQGTPDTTLPLTLYWQVNQPLSGDFTPFVHLEDQWGHRWSQEETFAYPASQWESGERIVQRVDVPIPPGTPPGVYLLRVGLFSGTTGTQLPRLDAHGRYAGTAAIIEGVSIQAGGIPQSIPQPPLAIDREVRPYLRLLGYERGKPEAATGEPYGVGLWWLATKPVPATNIQFALKQLDGAEHILLNTQPVHNTYPFYEWQTPQFIIDHHLFTIPEDVPANNYHLVVRFLDDNEAIIRRVNLGSIRVAATQRLFTPPQYETAVKATFGNEIELLGYSLNPTTEPGHYTLNLIWQAVQPPKADYTVFVHLLWPDGTCDPCVWQQDNMPQQGQSVTTRWLTNEVVIDTYSIVLPTDAPTGAYPLEIGLYIGETGQRLQIIAADGTQSDAILLEPLDP